VDIQSDWLVIGARVLTALVSMLMTYWSIRALGGRRKLHIQEFSDYMLVIVGVYWSAYSIYTVYTIGGQIIPMLKPTGQIDTYLFSVRFGLLLTLVVLTALVKDRILLTDLFEKVNDLNGGGDNGTREP